MFVGCGVRQGGMAVDAARLAKYAGEIVVLIYADRKGAITQRRVKLIAVEGGRVRAYCLERMAPRTFLAESVLAALPAAAARRPAARWTVPGRNPAAAIGG